MNKTLRKILIDRDTSTLELAHEIGVTPEYLSSVINGRRKGVPVRYKIAEALNMSYKELWEKAA